MENNMVEFVNLTPHVIVLNSGESFPATGNIARVASGFSTFDDNKICQQTFGEVENLPEPQPGKIFIVSALVLGALKGSREDVVAPATGHPDCVRENGFIKSVPGFVR